MGPHAEPVPGCDWATIVSSPSTVGVGPQPHAQESFSTGNSKVSPCLRLYAMGCPRDDAAARVIVTSPKGPLANNRHQANGPRLSIGRRNGRQYDWSRHAEYLYHTEAADQSTLVESRWGEGRLDVSAGGKAFRCEVGEDGRVIFTNSP